MSHVLTIDQLKNDYFGPVSFRLTGGEITCLMGPSGSGKSSLLRAIADLDQAEGICQFNGTKREDISAQNWRQSIAYLPAVPAWWGHLVRDHFSNLDTLMPLMAQLGLEAPLLDQPARDVSTGEAVRFGLLRAVLNQPSVYLLDEPTASLDETTRALVHDLVRQQVAKGRAILWITHHKAEAELVGDRLMKMNEGGMIEEQRQ